jgi:hypothetical protein
VHPQPELQWVMTLNAVIALLTTVMKTALAIPLIEGIDQLK